MPKIIRALSFDADNCLFHRGYKPTVQDILQGRSENQVITANRRLFDKLKKENRAYGDVIVLDGSLRQHYEVDILNAVNGDTGSIFVALRAVASELKATLDTFLTADIYENEPYGTMFERAEERFHKHAQTEFKQRNVERLMKATRKVTCDTTKASTLYAQVHKLATQYPDDTIVFDFYDDKKFEILLPLMQYYQRYPQLLPRNVLLQLNFYEGENDVRISSIQGTGFIDKNFDQSMKQMQKRAALGNRSLQATSPTFLPARQPFNRLYTYLGSYFFHDILGLPKDEPDDVTCHRFGTVLPS